MRCSILPVLACLLALAGCTEADVPSRARPQPTSRRAAISTLPGFADVELVHGLSSPTAMAFAPDGRLFICEQEGALRVVRDGQLLPTPFVTVNTDSRGERGLLGVALDPGFPTRSYVYVYYTALSPSPHNRVSRFTASGDRAVAGSESILFELGPLTSATSHNGGALHFGEDGKLYVAVGDNAHPVDAPSLDSLHGKLLRLERDGGIPTDNPFFSRATGVYRAIWARGLRNPYNFAVQPGTGRLFVNDVGQNHWEEVNEGVAGADYGWPDTEGPTSDPRFHAPLYAYGHAPAEVRGCAITGGAFYNPPTVTFPSQYLGRYFFADYCDGWIRALDPEDGTTTLFATGLEFPVDLAVGPDGSLSYLDRGSGSVHRITYAATPGQPPTLLRQPVGQQVSAGQAAAFTVAAEGSPPLRYQWQRDGVNLSGETGPRLTVASVVAADSGARFRVRVSNSVGAVLSAEAVLTVTGGTAPVATFVMPAEGTRFRATETLVFAGFGTDAEDGDLPASAFTWRVDFHHDDHLHPFLPATSGSRSGSFTVPDRGETSANVWYRVHLEVKDSTGATHAVSRDVYPRKVKLTVDSQPPGFRVMLDGAPVDGAVEVDSVVGLVHTLGVVPSQVKDGVSYVFQGWSDRGPPQHEVHTPDGDAHYTATFRAVAAGLGLRGEYFDRVDLTGPRLERVDPTVNFGWDYGSPAPALGPDTFSVRWSGSVLPLYSEVYTFHTRSNDGVRLWVDGQLLIDNWTRHTTQEDQGSILLEAGRAHSLRMEFYEQWGAANARLLWSSLRQRKQVIPPERLRPTFPPGP